MIREHISVYIGWKLHPENLLSARTEAVSYTHLFKGEVQSVSVLRQLVKVIVTLENDEKEIREYKVSQLKFRPKRRRDKGNVNDAELKALEAMDRKEGKSSL